MRTFIHVINPVKVKKDRDLYFQQPITFETMFRAREFAKKSLEIVQVAVFYEEDRDFIPWYFARSDPLEESTLDLPFKISRKLPYLWEILDKAIEFVVNSDTYIIQTNVDIGLQPYFYLLLDRLIDTGNPSFCINKRIVPEGFNDIEDIPVIWSTFGTTHAGHDCFVFPAGSYRNFRLGSICMGTPWSEANLIASMVAFCNDFRVFKNAHATFHIGDRRIWLPKKFNDYRIHNCEEFARVLTHLTQSGGRRAQKILKHDSIKYLLQKLEKEVIGYTEQGERYSKTCWKLIKDI